MDESLSETITDNKLKLELRTPTIKIPANKGLFNEHAWCEENLWRMLGKFIFSLKLLNVVSTCT